MGLDMREPFDLFANSSNPEESDDISEDEEELNDTDCGVNDEISEDEEELNDTDARVNEDISDFEDDEKETSFETTSKETNTQSNPGSDTMNCSQCDSSFDCKDDLKIHLGEVHMEDELLRMLGKIFPEGSDKCADCGHEIDSEYVKQEHIMLEHAWPTLVANVEEIEGAGKGKNAEESDIEEEKVEGNKAEENDMEEKEDADQNDEESDKEENEDDL